MERSYIAFISYKHAERDSAIAKQVHTLIENYVIPKSLRKNGKKLGVVFRDEEELPISSDLTESICTALDASQYLIVICSPEAKQSPWVAREVNYFLQHHDAKNAFVVLADGEPNDVFPHELTHVLNPETGEYQDVEPLAMDVRADSIPASLKKARTYIKKLYAGMLGCSYDSLVQREKARKLKRIVALAALCVLLAGCFIGMLFVKNRELSQKNDELTAAIELALNRESELLVERADEALAQGDVAAALKYASDALYSEDVERPYYAPAERALFYAADVLREEPDSPMLKKLALKHRAPIENMTYSGDGSAFYTIDAYGTVSSYDTSNGDLLWNVKLSDKGESATSNVKAQLWHDDESGIVACYYDEYLSGLDASTGQLLWLNEFENTVQNGVFHDAAGQKLAYIEKDYTMNMDDAMQSYIDYYFVVYSIQDGSMLHRIPFEGFRENPWDLDLAQFGGYGYDTSSGMFTDSNGFVGMVFKTENDVRKALLYTIDLSENSARCIENSSYHEDMRYIRTFYIGGNRALVVCKEYGMDPETELTEVYLKLQCFDVKAGSLVWENAVETEKNISPVSDCCIVPRSASTVLAIGENMLVIDNETGEIKTSSVFNAEIIRMNPVEAEGRLFSFTLKDGYSAIGWSNDNGLYDSSYYSATVDLPDTSEAVVYNGGLVQVYFTGNSIDGFGIEPEQDGGSITYLSEDKCTAYVTSVLPQLALPEPIEVGEEYASTSIIGAFIDVNPQGKVLLGMAHLEDGYGLNVVDTMNHTMETIEVDEYLTSGFTQCIYLTADGQNVIVCTETGDIRIFDMDGNPSVLAEEETITLKVVKNTQLVASKYRSDAARLASDGRVLIGNTDGQNITLWMDGTEETTIPVPEDVCWSVSDNAYLRAMLRTGENGLLVLSDFVSEDERAIDHFAVYDLSSKKWKLISDAVHGIEDRMVVFGDCSPVFAVYDEDMKIRVYDYNSASLAQCINTELPMVSVEKIGMLLDDRYIYLLTKDGQFIIYCVETNEQVFRTIFDGISQAKYFSNWLDRENSRLYLRAEGNALCIDIRAWEQLFSAKDFKFYSAAQNEVYVYNRNSDTATYSLKAIPIPSTSEMIDMTLNTLN